MYLRNMRRILTPLALAAVGALLLAGLDAPAEASSTPQTAAIPYAYFANAIECHQFGYQGYLAGRWSSYYCTVDIVPGADGLFELYVVLT
jgi:hypothetical protein